MTMFLFHPFRLFHSFHGTEQNKVDVFADRYTSQCPFNGKYVPIIEAVAKDNGVPFKAIHLQSKEEAQNAPTPITTYAVFHDGEYITNEQMNDKRFLKLIGK